MALLPLVLVGVPGMFLDVITSCACTNRASRSVWEGPARNIQSHRTLTGIASGSANKCNKLDSDCNVLILVSIVRLLRGNEPLYLFVEGATPSPAVLDVAVSFSLS